MHLQLSKHWKNSWGCYCSNHRDTEISFNQIFFLQQGKRWEQCRFQMIQNFNLGPFSIWRELSKPLYLFYREVMLPFRPSNSACV